MLFVGIVAFKVTQSTFQSFFRCLKGFFISELHIILGDAVDNRDFVSLGSVFGRRNAVKKCPCRALQSFKSSSFGIRQVVTVKQGVNISNQLLNIRLVVARHLVDVIAVHGVGQTGDLVRNLCDTLIQILALCSRRGQLVPFDFSRFAVVKRLGDVEDLSFDRGYCLCVA